VITLKAQHEEVKLEVPDPKREKKRPVAQETRLTAPTLTKTNQNRRKENPVKRVTGGDPLLTISDNTKKGKRGGGGGGKNSQSLFGYDEHRLRMSTAEIREN